MEHEFEKIIRMKVDQAGSTPANWNKELVWESIRFPERKKTTPVYYAAASLLLAGSLVFYTAGKKTDQEFTLKLKAIDLSIQKARLRNAELLSKPVREVITDCPPVATPGVAVIPKKRYAPPKSEPASPVIINEPVLTDNFPEPELPVPEKDDPIPASEHAVRVIIGGEHVGMVATKEKKLKFSLLPVEEFPDPNQNIVQSKLKLD